MTRASVPTEREHQNTVVQSPGRPTRIPQAKMLDTQRRDSSTVICGARGAADWSHATRKAVGTDTDVPLGRAAATPPTGQCVIVLARVRRCWSTQRRQSPVLAADGRFHEGTSSASGNPSDLSTAWRTTTATVRSRPQASTRQAAGAVMRRPYRTARCCRHSLPERRQGGTRRRPMRAPEVIGALAACGLGHPAEDSEQRGSRLQRGATPARGELVARHAQSDTATYGGAKCEGLV